MLLIIPNYQPWNKEKSVDYYISRQQALSLINFTNIRKNSVSDFIQKKFQHGHLFGYCQDSLHPIIAELEFPPQDQSETELVKLM